MPDTFTEEAADASFSPGGGPAHGPAGSERRRRRELPYGRCHCR